MRRVATLFVLLAFYWPALAQDETPAQAPIKTGIYTTAFDLRSPYSNRDAMCKIARWSPTKVKDYDLADHTFQLVVPEDYDGSQAYGLLVFIHSKDKVSIEQWFYGRVLEEVLAEHKLIWVSYNNAGNPVMPNIRMGLALDAVHNAKKQFKIDDRRVYVSGVSGGGRMTCMAGIYYPEVFTGGIPIIGTLYFRDAKLPQAPALRALIKPDPPEGAGVWPRGLITPSKRKLNVMKTQQRWALLAGETDYNMPQMRAHYEQGFQRDGFEHAHYLEVPGMAHDYPPADWMAKAISLLDGPLAAKDPGNLPPADERTQRLAQKRLDVALRTLERDQDRGVRALQRLIEDLPNTTAAAEAKEKLDAIDKP